MPSPSPAPSGNGLPPLPPRRNSDQRQTISFALASFVPVKEDLWVPDKDRDRCCGCKRNFNLLRRKHHCRACADIFCEECSYFKLIAKDSLSSHEIVQVRVCAACFERYSARDGESLQQAVKPAKPRSRSSGADQSSAQAAQVRAAAAAAAHATQQMTAITEGETAATTIGTIPSLAAAPDAASRSMIIAGAAGAGIFLLLGVLCALHFLPWHSFLLAVPLLAIGCPVAARQLTPAAVATPTAPVTAPSPALLPTPSSSPPTPTLRSRSQSHSTEFAPLTTSTSFPNGVAGIALATGSLRELAEQGLTPLEQQLVKHGRKGLLAVQQYHRERDGWTTKRQTRPDGTGSVAIIDAQAPLDLDALLAARDWSIIVQCKSVGCFDGSTSSSHLTWRGIFVVPHPPEHLFRLYFDQDHQADWNKALLQCRILRTIKGTRTSVTYAVSAPAVGGAVSSRDFIDSHDWSSEERVDAEGNTHTDFTFAGQGLTAGQYPHPAKSAFVRGINGPSGFLMRSIMPFEPPAAAGDAARAAWTAASRAVPPADTSAEPPLRWTQFMCCIDTDVKGWIPRSLAENAMPDVTVEYAQDFRAAWVERTQKGTPLPPPAPDVYS